MNEIDLRLELLRMAKQHAPNGPAEEVTKTAREWLTFILAEAVAPNSSLVKQLTEEPGQLARVP